MDIFWWLIKFVFWLIIGVALLHALVTHFLLWYEWRIARLQNQETIRTTWPTLFKSFMIEFFCVVIKPILFFFQFKTLEFSNKHNTGTLPPILLVHGYMNHKGDWLWFMKELQKNPDIGPIYSLNLTPLFASISQLALLVKDKVNDIQAATGATEVILIGHSMGGIVSSYYSEYLAKPGEVSMVIALGSPFQGTRLSALGYGQSIHEMAPNSPFLAELRERIHQSSIPYYSIASKIDNMVVPWRSALLDERVVEQIMILEDHGHLRLVISPPIVQQITKWIAKKYKGTY